MSKQASVSNARFMYTASYTYPHFAPGASKQSSAKGISVYKIETDGSLELIQIIETPNPSFITLNKDNTMLYTVNELGVDDKKLEGMVSAFNINQQSGELSFVNSQPTHGNWPCHCEVDASGRFLMSANYGSANFVTHPINEDGSLGECVYQHTNKANGSGAEANRQSASHPHMITNSPSGKYVLGVDLGIDQILCWTMGENGSLDSAPVPIANIASGNGPRHLVFHPSEKAVYVLNELSSSIDVFRFYSERGSMIWTQSISMLPTDSDYVRPDFDPTNPGKVMPGGNTGGEICIDSKGNYLYASNRGMNSVAQFKVSPETFKLTALDWAPTQGDCPRGMAIEPDDCHLCIGNQNSDRITRFTIDRQTGLLNTKPTFIDTPTPVDFAFIGY
ncbi:lactonase family protein [Vibrio maerlii]|uniref:lactonase family protein n=1 Tax=Vibrio maerlii TaxID=2231648 RepID=UPI000E3BB9C5|nr:lactonase family protein [Vibrio maerlii]